MNDFPALPPEQLYARLMVVEAAVAAIAQVALTPKHWREVLAAVEEVEKGIFRPGLPAGRLPLGAQMLKLQLGLLPNLP
jgi:hypothetical protein